MTRLDPSELADVLVSLPASQIAGLLAASPDWKARAAAALANDIVTRLEGLPPVDKDEPTPSIEIEISTTVIMFRGYGSQR